MTIRLETRLGRLEDQAAAASPQRTREQRDARLSELKRLRARLLATHPVTESLKRILDAGQLAAEERAGRLAALSAEIAHVSSPRHCQKGTAA